MLYFPENMIISFFQGMVYLKNQLRGCGLRKVTGNHFCGCSLRKVFGNYFRGCSERKVSDNHFHVYRKCAERRNYMNKKIAAVLLSMLLLLTGCFAPETTGTAGCKAVDSAYAFKQVFMCDTRTGWALTTENELLFTDDDLEEFSIVKKLEGINSGTNGFASASFLNGQTVYLAYFPEDDGYLAVEYTNDGGVTWQKTLLDYTGFGDTCDAGSVILSFSDEQNGYLLYCSTPAAGSMTKLLLKTVDGGASFSVAADLSSRIAGYPQGISFHGDKIYLPVSYHGTDSYLYISSDGRMTWEDGKILPAEEISAGGGTNYIDGYPPAFSSLNQDRGMIILKVVKENAAYQLLRTQDRGSSWKVSGEVPCDDLCGYACIGDKGFLFWDGAGRLYEMLE